MGRASALHTLALNLPRWSSSFAQTDFATPIILYSQPHLRLPPSCASPPTYTRPVSFHRHRFSMFARRLISLCSFRLEKTGSRYRLRDIPLRNGTGIKIKLTFAISPRNGCSKRSESRPHFIDVYKPCLGDGLIIEVIRMPG